MSEHQLAIYDADENPIILEPFINSGGNLSLRDRDSKRPISYHEQPELFVDDDGLVMVDVRFITDPRIAC